MPVDKEEKFDKMLCRALQGHSEVVPADFAGRMLRQIREAENSRILARLVMEERLTLAGCIVLGIMAIVMVSVFPGVAVSFKELAATSIYKITRTIEAVRYDWRSYMVFAGVFGFAVCSLVDLLVSDS
jgi:hypothetical protein